MDMSVGDGLSGGLAVVDSNIEAIGPKFLGDVCPDPGDEGPDVGLFVGVQAEDAGDVAAGDDEHVAVGDGEFVSNGKGVVG